MSNMEIIDLTMLQKFPMQMMLKEVETADDFIFETKFSCNDFFNNNNEIPTCVLLELLGQAAEMSLRISGDISKKYLVQVNGLNIESDLLNNLYMPFLIEVKIVQRFGKMIKSQVSLISEGKVICAGDFMHADVE